MTIDESRNAFNKKYLVLFLFSLKVIWNTLGHIEKINKLSSY